MQQLLVIASLALGLTVSACANSEFSGRGGQVGTPSNRGKTPGTESGPNAGKNNGPNSGPNAGPLSGPGANASPSLTIDGKPQVVNDAAANQELAGRNDQATGHIADESERGCALPAGVGAAFTANSVMQRGAFGLQGWGGVGGGGDRIGTGGDQANFPPVKLLLHNVDVERCAWRAEVNGNPEYKAVIALTQDNNGEKQTYLEPFGLTDPTIRGNLAVCMAAAAATPNVVCAPFERNPDGTAKL